MKQKSNPGRGSFARCVSAVKLERASKAARRNNLYTDVDSKAEAVKLSAELKRAGYVPQSISKSSEWGDKFRVVYEKKRNPAAAASEAYTDFHGRPSEETVTVKTEVHYHKHLAACGELRKLVVKPVGKLFTVSLSNFKKALLAFNEKRTQLFIEGGDQAVDLKQFGIRTPHEVETLGEVRVIEYFTEKDHLGDEGGKAVYVHKFHKPYPVLIYNVLDRQLSFSGGSYVVLAEGIDK